MTLGDRLEALLDLRGPLTAEELARSAGVRTTSVRQALNGDDLRFVAVSIPGRSRLAVGWMLRPLPYRGGDGIGRALDEPEGSDAGEKTSDSSSLQGTYGTPSGSLSALPTDSGAARRVDASPPRPAEPRRRNHFDDPVLYEFID